ncbi:hypothetical protein RB614_37530 [Phytohabitans sp. ZYX-F-186]|uniref:Uncharacterized protein n=1 Tax=Phytohabitans maris TaxID=3071409 RepID=A0ABU0ZT53_9ACTN|nr:hypothetical protein [Phytohabitans sp. ZYX-F-186]MDQ7910213.1 hypothetical protein [Phytohabitans sp. ZYX-F-186]
MSNGLFKWTPARLINTGDVIYGDVNRFQVIDCDPVIPCRRIVLTLVDLDTGRQREFRVRWNDEYPVAHPNAGGGR